MNISVTHISDTRVMLEVTLEPDELVNAEQVALKKLSNTVKVPGFRKGHVPIEVAKKYLNPVTIAEESLDAALSRGVAEAFMSKDIQVLERPEVEVKKYVPGELVEFTAEADVMPDITLGNYKKLSVKKIVSKPAKKDVDEVIERMRSGFAETKAVERKAKIGDETIIDFIGKKDDVAFDGGTASDYPLTLGSNSFIPGFEEALVGHKTGDVFDIPLTFPEDYQAKELAGKLVTFSVTLKEVRERILPELNDEFAAKVGDFTDIDGLRQDIAREIEAKNEREALDDFKDNLVRELVKISKVTAPQVLVDDQLRSIEQDLVQNLAYRGSTVDQYYTSRGFKDRDEWVAAEGKSAAEDRVKAGLVLAELSKQEKIEASDEELAARIEIYRTQYGSDKDFAKRIKEPEVQRSIANELLTSKSVDRLVELNS